MLARSNLEGCEEHHRWPWRGHKDGVNRVGTAPRQIVQGVGVGAAPAVEIGAIPEPECGIGILASALQGQTGGASGCEIGGPTMLGSCRRPGHHRDILVGDAPRMNQILSMNQRGETVQTGISNECWSRWWRAPST